MLTCCTFGSRIVNQSIPCRSPSTHRKLMGRDTATYKLDLSNAEESILGGMYTPTFLHSPPMDLLVVTAHAEKILLGSTCNFLFNNMHAPVTHLPLGTHSITHDGNREPRHEASNLKVELFF